MPDPETAAPAPETATPSVSTVLHAVAGSADTVEVDAVVVGLLTGPRGASGDSGDSGDSDGPVDPVLAPGADELDAAFDGGLVALLVTAGATGKADEVTRLPTRGAITAPLLVAVGLGAPAADAATVASVEPDAVRRAAGAAARALAGTGHAASTLGRLDLAAAAEGTLLGCYAFTAYQAANAHPAPVRVDLLSDASDATQVVARASVVGTAVARARDLVNTPPNDLFPASFAERARVLGELAGCEVEILDETALAEGGFGGIAGVGQGSSRPPRLVRLHWNGSGTAAARHVALIGKGITFDTGGISIKPAANMDHMTSDMAGAAAVVATVVAAAELRLGLRVTATVPMAENMPSDTAYRPGDVLRMYGGKTVEVLNTDAEGRLVLADAIVRAAEDSPDYLIDTATLTGAQTVALGMRTAGVMGTDTLRDRVAAHGRAVGEDAWSMPLPDYLRADLDSRVADLANITGARFGGMLAAGLFLKEFVPDGVPWCHIDIAGPSFHTAGPYGYTAKGGTGVPVRTLLAFLEDVAANG